MIFDDTLLSFVRTATNIRKKYIRFDSIYTKLFVFKIDLYSVLLMYMMILLLISSWKVAL